MASRKRRAKRTRIAIIIALLIGFALGFISGSKLAAPSDTPDTMRLSFATEAPDENALPELDLNDESDETAADSENADTATESLEALEAEETEPVPTETPEPTEAPGPVESTMDLGIPAVISLSLNTDGTPCVDGDDVATATANVSISITSYLDPTYYRGQYGTTVNLNGLESAIAFEATLNAGTGVQSLDPTKAFKEISIVLENGTVDRGYQLESDELSQGQPPLMEVGVPATLYKPFDYSTPAKYLRIVTINNGVEYIYNFTIPAAKSPYKQLQKGDNNEDVVKLQQKLIEIGYLNGEADGAFGGKTEDAVKSAQFRYGLPQNGIADPDFLATLYGANQATPAAATTEVAPSVEGAATEETTTAAEATAAPTLKPVPTPLPTEIPNVVG